MKKGISLQFSLLLLALSLLVTAGAESMDGEKSPADQDHDSTHSENTTVTNNDEDIEPRQAQRNLCTAIGCNCLMNKELTCNCSKTNPVSIYIRKSNQFVTSLIKLFYYAEITEAHQFFLPGHN